MKKRLGNGKFGKENQDLKKLGRGRISSYRELYTPLIPKAGTVPGLDEHEPVLVRELFRLLVGHVPLALKVRLVSDQKNHLKRQT